MIQFQKLPPNFRSLPPSILKACTHALTVHLNTLLCGIFFLTLSALQKQRGGDRRVSWLYRCRTGAVMRCRTGCCSWKSRPPFSAHGALLSAALLASSSGDSPPLLQRSLDVQGAPSIHFARVRLPGQVTMATHSLRLCHVNSNSSSFFPSFLLPGTEKVPK